MYDITHDIKIKLKGCGFCMVRNRTAFGCLNNDCCASPANCGSEGGPCQEESMCCGVD